TDDQGVFRIPNVPQRDAVLVYGLMDGLKAHGAVGVWELRTGASGAEADAGDLTVRPGLRLAGRLVLADGQPVPAGTRGKRRREAPLRGAPPGPADSRQRQR